MKFCVELPSQSTKSPTLKHIWNGWLINKTYLYTHCNRTCASLFQRLKPLIIYISNTLWSHFSDCRPYPIFLPLNFSYSVCREQIAWGKNSKFPILLNKLTGKSLITSIHPKQKFSLLSIS